MLLLQLCVLHSQLEAGELGHERLVTHMERVRDRQLEREQRERKTGGGKLRVERASRREGLVKERGDSEGGRGRKQCKLKESNDTLTSFKLLIHK